jgi:hypothetical protein
MAAAALLRGSTPGSAPAPPTLASMVDVRWSAMTFRTVARKRSAGVRPCRTPARAGVIGEATFDAGKPIRRGDIGPGDVGARVIL